LTTLRDSLRRIAPLAWPVLVGQLAVLAFATVDTVLVARHSANDLAAFAVGAAIYVTVFVGLMGVVLAVGPICGQMFGAGRFAEAGRQLQQSVWLSLGLTLVGSGLLLFPQPFLALAGASVEQGARISGYLLALAFSLPASLLFTAYRGFNTAVSRPKAAMALQLAGLAIKIPLSAALVFGVASWGIPALGVVGCGIATLVAMWAQAFAAAWVLRRDPFYRRFDLFGHGLGRPHRASLMAQIRLGVPMGLGILIEVSGFSLMAIFISRLGPTAVAGHQIAANLISLLFMVPLALANAISTLVAQSIGAADIPAARRIGWHGLQIVAAVAAVMACAIFIGRESVVGLYSNDPAVIAAALPLLAWILPFHIGDAMQTAAAFVLRAWRVATAPMLIYAFSLWGVGLGGGYCLAFDIGGATPAGLLGARGFWFAATVGLALASAALIGFLAWMLHERERST
jgi:MATE family multidrug resistance protein